MTDELRGLADAALDGRATPDQAARFEELVLTDPAACRWFADYSHQHAALRWAAEPPATVRRTATRRSLAWAVVAAGLLAGLPLLVWAARGPATVATITEAKACKWESGTLPTAVGAELAPGRLRLAEGLARLRFSSGVEMTVEGPADLELRSPMVCVLHSGQVTAKVPPPATGFVVRTPQSVVTDYGTEFGVTVRDNQTADVMVFDGKVEVSHTPTGKVEALTAGAGRRFGPAGANAFSPDAQRPPAGPPVPAGTRLVSISTAQGRGRDAFVQPLADAAVPADRRSDTLLLVKLASGPSAQWNRKAYLGFDLAPLAGRRVLEAELCLTFAPTGMGFAALVPDCTFTAWGLLPGPGGDWDERAVRWDTAPANRPDAALDTDRAVRLGGVVLPQGEQSGTLTVTGPAVADWLRRAAPLGTVVVVRDTLANRQNQSDLVHGIASRRHPTLPPPTLRVTIADPR